MLLDEGASGPCLELTEKRENTVKGSEENKLGASDRVAARRKPIWITTEA